MQGLVIEGEVVSVRAGEPYNDRPGGYWLLLEDSAGRQYSVKSDDSHSEGDQVVIAVAPRPKKNGEGFWYLARTSRPAQIRSVA